MRDKIPRILESRNIPYKSHVANNEEYEEKLYEKLLEEAKEVQKEKTIDEIADVLEVIYAIMDLNRFHAKDVEMARKKKLEERGGFTQRIILQES